MIIEKHSRLPRKFTPGESPKRITRRGKAVPEEIRKRILEDTKTEILAGKTLAQIAAKHGIAERTLEYWLSAMGDEYQELRRVWIDNMLAEARELLRDPGEDDKAPLRLAKARELWKSATWYAERRDRARYGEERQQVNVVAPILNINITELPDQALVCTSRVSQVIDVQPQQSTAALSDKGE